MIRTVSKFVVNITVITIFAIFSLNSLSEARAYTLSELESRALESHPAISGAVSEIHALQGKKMQAGLSPNPVFSYTGSEMGNDGKGGFQGGTISQEIVTAGKLQKDQSVVDQEILAARYNLSAIQLMVVKQIRQAGYEVMAARRIVAVNETIKNIVQQTLDNSESLYKSGQLSLTDLYLIRIESKNANLEWENSKTRYWNAWKQLAASVGDVNLPPEVMEDTLDTLGAELTWEGISAKIETQSPELAQAQTRYLQASAQYHAEVARKTPNIEIEAGMQYDCSSNYNTGLVTISVPIPFYNQNQGNIAQAQAQINQAVSEAANMNLSIRQRLARAFTQYETAKRQLEWFKTEIEPDLQKALNTAQNAFKQGEINTQQLQAVQKNYFEQIRSIIEIKAQLQSSAAEIAAFFID